MTLSPATRQDSQRRLLDGLLDLAGSDAFYKEFTATAVADVLRHSWAELEADGIIEPVGIAGDGKRWMRFTRSGWVDALERTGRFQQLETLERARRLMAHLKGLADRADAAEHSSWLFEYGYDFEAWDDGNWFHCAIESGLLMRMFPADRCDLIPVRRGAVRVPVIFGRKR